MILSLTHNNLRNLHRAKWNYENCIEKNKIVQIQRNNYLVIFGQIVLRKI